MRILTTDPLFAWEKLPDSVDLIALRHLLDMLPDQSLLEALRTHRGRGRNDYPVHVLWRTHLARYLLRHNHMWKRESNWGPGREANRGPPVSKE